MTPPPVETRKASPIIMASEPLASKRAKLDLPAVTVLVGEELKLHVGPQLDKMAKAEALPFDHAGIYGYDQGDYRKALKNANSYDCRIPMHWFPFGVWWIGGSVVGVCVCVCACVCVCVCVCVCAGGPGS